MENPPETPQQDDELLGALTELHMHGDSKHTGLPEALAREQATLLLKIRKKGITGLTPAEFARLRELHFFDERDPQKD